MSAAYQHLVALIVGQFEVRPEDVEPSATLAQLGVDSLATAELAVALECEWGGPARGVRINERMTLRQVADVFQESVSMQDPRAGEGLP